MNDFEIKDLYEQVQLLEEQVQFLIEALISNDCCVDDKD